jgi:phosphoribosylformylglycinamidine cyclo-ligase
LLAPHVNYVNGIQALLAQDAPIRSMAHITGGRIAGECAARPAKTCAAPFLFPRSWQAKGVFEAIRTLGNISAGRCNRTFNMGIGLTVVVPSGEAQAVFAVAGEGVLPTGVGSRNDRRRSGGTWIEGVTPTERAYRGHRISRHEL